MRVGTAVVRQVRRGLRGIELKVNAESHTVKKYDHSLIPSARSTSIAFFKMTERNGKETITFHKA